MKTKNYLAALGAVSALVCFTEVPAKADFNTNILKVIRTLSGSNSETICRKGDFWAGTFSVRSFEGNLCTTPYVAAFAELTCANVKGYPESHCAKKAKAALNGLKAEDVLKAAIKAGTGHVRGLTCDQLGKLTASVQGIVSGACKAEEELKAAPETSKVAEVKPEVKAAIVAPKASEISTKKEEASEIKAREMNTQKEEAIEEMPTQDAPEMSTTSTAAPAA